uniref:Uncharacterized protein n=1 Tax=Chrysemys picta bellii TaxID=8478 RepID=A0A8C3HPE1_CHRPI
VWIRLCRFRCSLFRKFFPHSSHVWGRSPTWICWCSLRCTGMQKFFPQPGLLYGFSPAWILCWILRVCLQLKLLPQSLRTCSFTAWTPQRVFLDTLISTHSAFALKFLESSTPAPHAIGSHPPVNRPETKIHSFH